MYEGRIKHLEVMHESLDNQIDGLEKTGKFDDTHLNTLKRQRLQIKDQLTDLRRRQYEHDHELIHDDND